MSFSLLPFGFWLLPIAFCLLASAFCISSCKHDVIFPPDYGYSGKPNLNPTPTPPPPSTGNPCSPDSVYFNQEVLPILVSNCTMSGCHGASSGGELSNFTSYASVMASGTVKSGNPSGSRLYSMITGSGGEDRMPPSPRTPLTSAQIALIDRWILQGAQNLSCTSSCDTTAYTYSGAIAPVIQTYCLGCHSSSSLQGGVNLSSYSNVFTYAENGKLMYALTTKSDSLMPFGTSGLSSCDIAQFKKWIQNGAKNN